ncbi:unnamed protein product [Closterium sp. NIES-65]|nr:unnamed protein product [Closterium sp. NIES-65]
MASAHHSFRSLSLDSGSKPPALQQEASRALGLYDDPGELLNPLDQGAFFSAVAAGNVDGVAALLKHRKVDINEYNGQGVTAIFVAVYNFESSRCVSMAKLLLDHGAKVTVRAVDSPAASKLCYLKHESPTGSPGSPRSPRSPRGMAAGRKDETRKVSVANKTPLLPVIEGLGLSPLRRDAAPAWVNQYHVLLSLFTTLHHLSLLSILLHPQVALELKSSLYLKGWDYRHWDAMLDLLADATVAELAGHPFHGPGPAQLPAVADGWAAVFGSGGHELVEVWAEGKHIDVLKMLLVVQSKVWAEGKHLGVLKMLVVVHSEFELEKAAAVSPGRLEITDASFNVVKAVMEFLYTGHVSREFMGHRGVDLLLAAHKYEVFALQKLCEEQLEPTPVMNTRHATRLFVKQPFSASIHPEGGPAQLPLIDDAGVEEEVEVKTL